MSSKRIYVVAMVMRLGVVSCCLAVIGRLYWAKHTAPLLDTSLLNLHVEVDKVDDSGFTELMKETMWGEAEEVRKLLDKGVDPNVKSMDINPSTFLPYGNTALMIAIWNSNFEDNYEVAKLLLDRGVDVRIANNVGDTPVHYTMQVVLVGLVNMLTEPRIELLKRVLKLGGNINAQNDDGNTMVHIAVYNQEIQWIELLRSWFGSLIDWNLKNTRGQTAQQLAEDIGTDTKKAFEKPIVIIGASGNGAERDLILGYTGLMLALMRGDTRMAGWLLEKGADINAVSADPLKMTALHIVLRHQLQEMVHFLVDRGARVDVQDWLGNYPIHYVLFIDGVGKKGFDYINARNAAAGYLLDKKADVNAQNFEGNTVLHKAVELGATAFVEYLAKKAGLQIRLGIVNKKGRTAFDIAKELKRVEILKILSDLEVTQKVKR